MEKASRMGVAPAVSGSWESQRPERGELLGTGAGPAVFRGDEDGVVAGDAVPTISGQWALSIAIATPQGGAGPWCANTVSAGARPGSPSRTPARPRSGTVRQRVLGGRQQVKRSAPLTTPSSRRSRLTLTAWRRGPPGNSRRHVASSCRPFVAVWRRMRAAASRRVWASGRVADVGGAAIG